MPLDARTDAPWATLVAVVFVVVNVPVDGLNCSFVELTFSVVIEPVVALVNVK